MLRPWPCKRPSASVNHTATKSTVGTGKRESGCGPDLLFGISDRPEVLQLDLQLGLALSHSPSQLSLLSMFSCYLGGQLELTPL